MPYTILVAEDDPSIAELIRLTLSLAPHDCVCADTGDAALALIASRSFDLALLDIMLPGVDGYALLEALRARGTPALFVTAKVDLADRVHGLRLGADDYITKPFEPLELLARVDAALRRVAPRANVLRIGDIELDVDRHAVAKAGEPVSVTPLEYDLLELMMRNPNLVFSRTQLLDRIWGYDYYGNTRTVDMHVQKLRAKLDLGDRIQTVHKIGYRLVTP